jgi:hypothetical protein
VRHPSHFQHLSLDRTENEIKDGDFAGYWITGGEVAHDYQRGYDHECGPTGDIDIDTSRSWVILETFDKHGDTEKQVTLKGDDIWKVLDEDWLEQRIADEADLF